MLEQRITTVHKSNRNEVELVGAMHYIMNESHKTTQILLECQSLIAEAP